MGGDFVETFKSSEVVVVAANLCYNIGLISRACPMSKMCSPVDIWCQYMLF